MILALAVVVVSFRAWRRWRTDAYRREALRELHGANSTAEVAEILKRTALVAYDRSQVASLSGAAWTQWLGQTAGVIMPAHIGEALTHGVFAKGDSGDTAEVAAFAADWVLCHHAGTDHGKEDRED